MNEPILADRIAIITGASSGIGAAVAKCLAAMGAAVVVNYHRSRTAAEEVWGSIVQTGGRAVLQQADVSTEQGVRSLFEVAHSTFGVPNTLVNNAGRFAPTKLSLLDDEHFSDLFMLNVRGVLYGCKLALEYFTEGGSVINVGSMSSTLTPEFSVVYNASKAAVDTVTRTLAPLFGRRDVRLLSVNPSLVDTEGLRESGYYKLLGHKARSTAVGRLWQADEVAEVVARLASPRMHTTQELIVKMERLGHIEIGLTDYRD